MLLCKSLYSSFDQNLYIYKRFRFVSISYWFDIESFIIEDIYNLSIFFADEILFYWWTQFKGGGFWRGAEGGGGLKQYSVINLKMRLQGLKGQSRNINSRGVIAYIFRREAGKEGFRAGWMHEEGIQERRASGKDGFRKGWIQERKDAGKEGCRKGGLQERRD